MTNLTFDDFALGDSLALWDDLNGATIENPPPSSYLVPESDDTVSMRIAPIAGSQETTDVDIAVLPALWETPLTNTVQPLTPAEQVLVEPIINTTPVLISDPVVPEVIPEVVPEIIDPKSRKGKKGKKGKK